MSRIGKQRAQAKSILKEKLFNYQNELKNQSNIVIYDGFWSTKSQKFATTYFSKGSLDSEDKKDQIQGQYHTYLNFPYNEEDFNSQKKSLTRENIQAINRKGKILRSNLNQMSRKKSSVQIFNNPLRSLQNSRSLSPQNPEKMNPCNNKPQTERLLLNLLTIRKSKKQQIQRPYDYMKRSVSQQTTRKKTYRQKQNPLDQEKMRLKTSLNDRKKPLTQKQHQLIEYFTPCYHKQTNSGYIIKHFQPRIKAKHFQDNFKVMACMIKKKIYNLEGQQIMDYMRKISVKKSYYVPNNKIQQIVRKNNLLNDKNVQESKLMKTKKKVLLQETNLKKIHHK